MSVILGRRGGGSGGGGGAPSGPAGGSLGGTYPNPGFAVDMATQAELDAVALTVGMSLIGDSVLAGDQASFDTNTILGGNIPSTYKHLLIEMVLRSDRVANTDNAKVQFNADTTSANYKTQRLIASTSSVTTDNFNGTQPGFIAGETTAASAPASSFAQMSVKVNDYLPTTHHKMAQAQSIAYSDVTGPVLNLDNYAGIWLNTAAITRIVVAPLTGSNWKAGSRFTLYGLR